MDDPSTPNPPDTGNVTRLLHAGKELFVIGAAHVSRQSVAEVERVVEELRPSSVCVELDQARLETLTDETRWDRFDVREVLQKGRAGLFASALMFSGFQKRLGDRLGVRPGSEMLAAVAAARKIGAHVVLADRDVQATLLRCYRALGPIDRGKIMLVLLLLPFAAGDIDEAEVEKLKDQKAMGDVMETFAAQMPALKVPLIDERDQYLIAKVRDAPGPRVVAVVGAAHVPGMVKALETSIDCAALTALPPPGFIDRAAQWVLPITSLALIITGTLRGALPDVLLSLATPPAITTLIFLLLAGASARGVILGALLSPLSLLVPVNPVARYLGLSEAPASPPASGDARRLRDDVLSPRLARKNVVLRPVLITLAFVLSRRLGGLGGITWALLRFAIGVGGGGG